VIEPHHLVTPPKEANSGLMGAPFHYVYLLVLLGSFTLPFSFRSRYRRTGDRRLLGERVRMDGDLG
jgi:hypothetical protein